MTDKKLNVMNYSLDEILKCLDKIRSIVIEQEGKLCDFRDIILEAKEDDGSNRRRIFLGGAGRSGFVAKSFAMRLMHMGFEVYVFGESIVEQLQDDDILILISKSGDERSIPVLLQQKTDYKVRLLSVCGGTSCDLYGYSECSITIDEHKVNLPNDVESYLRCLKVDSRDLMVMGTDFEISALVLLDALVVELMHSLSLSSEQLKDRHDKLNYYVIIKEAYEKNGMPENKKI